MAGPLRIRGLDLAVSPFNKGLDLGAPPGTIPGEGYLVGAGRNGWALKKQRFGFSYVAIC